jgi:hypothetical protein
MQVVIAIVCFPLSNVVHPRPVSFLMRRLVHALPQHAGHHCHHLSSSVKFHTLNQCAFSCAGSYTRFLNMQVVIVICLQILLCCACAAGALAWRENAGEANSHLSSHLPVPAPT